MKARRDRSLPLLAWTAAIVAAAALALPSVARTGDHHVTNLRALQCRDKRIEAPSLLRGVNRTYQRPVRMTSLPVPGSAELDPLPSVSGRKTSRGTSGSDCSPSSFIGRLNAYLGTGKFRLPTEAEWEYAARAGTQTPFSFGDDPTCRMDDCSSCSTYAGNMWWCGNAANTTHPVGQKNANPWGLHDVHGNVWELVADWWGDYPTEAVTDPQGPSSGTTRVIRGGSWLYEPRYCRSAYRYSTSPYYAHYNIGFRLARSE